MVLKKSWHWYTRLCCLLGNFLRLFEFWECQQKAQNYCWNICLNPKRLSLTRSAQGPHRCSEI